MSTHFWGNIAISFFGGTAHPGLFKRAWDMLNFCLKNSEECQCPLSFSFGTGGSYYKEYSYVIDILDALLARSMRWVTASLVVNATEVRRLHCIKRRTPLLKSLTVANSGSWEWENLFTPTDPEFIDA